MIFVIGGSYQGKCGYVMEQLGLSESDIFVCTPETREIDFSKRIISHIEQFALGCVQRGEEPKDYWETNLSRLTDSILIADDVSCGVVPIDAVIRAWREATGRANNYLAREADHVWRVFCGLGQVIK